MKINVKDGDIVIDGKELTKEKIKQIMTENIVLKHQINCIRTINFTTEGGVTE